jgi:hypothetical protein
MDQIEDQVSLFQGQLSHLMDLPDEIVLEVLKLVSPEDLSRVKRVNRRLRALVLNYTVRLDYTAFIKDESVLRPPDFADLILQCPRLKALSLIKPADQPGHPACFMDSFLQPAKQRTRFAKLMSRSCPNIRLFEVSSLPSLRMVRDYARFLKQKAAITEIRLYLTKSLPVPGLMLAIEQCCPQLRVFKFLRREMAEPLARTDQRFDLMWSRMANKLTGFSTNVQDRQIIKPALTRLVHVRRLVIWFLTATEMGLMTQHCTQITTLILMSADPAGFKFLKRLPHLTDLTFCLQRDEYVQMDAFRADFGAVFHEIGSRLKRISFDFRKSSSAGCLSHLIRCTQLTDLKLRGFDDEDKISIYDRLLRLKSLRSLTWKDEDDESLTDVFTQKHIQKLFKNCPLLHKFILNETQYARRKSPESPAISDTGSDSVASENDLR